MTNIIENLKKSIYGISKGMQLYDEAYYIGDLIEQDAPNENYKDFKNTLDLWCIDTGNLLDKYIYTVDKSTVCLIREKTYTEVHNISALLCPITSNVKYNYVKKALVIAINEYPELYEYFVKTFSSYLYDSQNHKEFLELQALVPIPYSTYGTNVFTISETMCWLQNSNPCLKNVKNYYKYNTDIVICPCQNCNSNWQGHHEMLYPLCKRDCCV